MSFNIGEDEPYLILLLKELGIYSDEQLMDSFKADKFFDNISLSDLDALIRYQIDIIVEDNKIRIDDSQVYMNYNMSGNNLDIRSPTADNWNFAYICGLHFEKIKNYEGAIWFYKVSMKHSKYGYYEMANLQKNLGSVVCESYMHSEFLSPVINDNILFYCLIIDGTMKGCSRCMNVLLQYAKDSNFSSELLTLANFVAITKDYDSIFDKAFRDNNNTKSGWDILAEFYEIIGDKNKQKYCAQKAVTYFPCTIYIPETQHCYADHDKSSETNDEIHYESGAKRKRPYNAEIVEFGAKRKCIEGNKTE